MANIEPHNNDDSISERVSIEHRPRPRSSRSWRSRPSFTRSRSRPRDPDADLHRILDHHDTHEHDHDHNARSAEKAALASEPDPGAVTLPLEELADGEAREEVESQLSDEETPDKDEALSQPSGNTDPEKGHKSKLERQQTSASERARLMVSWDGDSDPENPKNWSNKRKWAAVLVVSSFTFISPVSSSMVAPALEAMNRDLGITNQVLSQMMLSIFILAYAVGPLVLGPLSEVYGRVPVLQLANLFFLIFNLVCGFAKTPAQMLVFRFLAGLGGSAPLAIGGGILADCFRPEERGKAIGIYSLAPLIGPAVGPIAGGFISENTTWRWVFWAVSIADAVIQIAGIFLLQETWAPKLLDKKTARLRKETGNQALYSEGSRRETVSQKLKTSLGRPFKLLFTQVTIIVFAIYMAYLYGLVYLVISSFPGLYTSPEYYNESVGIGGLYYIALAIGYAIGAQATSRINDYLYVRMKKSNNGVGKPEFRIPMMVPCSVLLPIGFFWYGWSAQARLFWIMPDIGAGILAAATICGYYSIQTYIIDSYTKYAASAVAAITTLRSLAGFGFPLFAPYLYNSLGYGWGNSVLAFVALAIGIPAPWFFWRYGERLRMKSQFAAGS
ncbi:hypothetical protein LTR78_002001 [Recurvomyces mirabilis]|uniref:Cercosporin MFS transporter CTB4 n=1 Tax=Recurvomyces mirabilis TaxID=574656 RepID=A0AAE0WTL6_9PEZI|nr:hypothetical protein LTR78_002001 [Recurvomyces mirabilis]KAK5160459.1 hypothetical protein LTS14_001471 [Recurvomyces mirabilis]